MATKKHRGKSSSSAGQAQLIETLANTSTSVDKETIAKMARLIGDMKVDIPTKTLPPVAMTNRVKNAPIPRLTTVEVTIMTLLDQPNEWFLFRTAKKRGGNGSLRSLGKGLEITTRVNNGMVEHYARWTGGPLSAEGTAKVKRIREKLRLIKEAVEKGVTIPARKTSKYQDLGSLKHVVKYPMNDTEETFIELLKRPNEKVLLRANSKSNEEFFTFRWKWETRYGFDLSQFTTSQEAQPDGTFHLYGRYTPNSRGEMNASLAKLVDVLEQKRKVRDEMKPRRETVTNTTTPNVASTFGTAPQQNSYIRI